MSPGKFDRISVQRHLDALDEALSQLERHAGRPLEELQNSLDERWIVERGLQLGVQNVLDIATHLAASAGRDVSDYTAAIDHLSQLQIIPKELAKQLRPLAGFRNALLYGYLGVELSVVHDVLNRHRSQLREFAVHVTQYMTN
jgi:uncharacterized protein YutE (UPF0331/DUF86 family)